MSGADSARTSLRDTKTFPSFRSLPAEYEIDRRYYADDGIGNFKAFRNWYFLGEITFAEFMIRPVFHVRDRDGEERLLALYLDEDVASTLDRSRFKIGRTVAVLHAHNRQFMDGNMGMRVENLGQFEVCEMTVAAFRAFCR